MRLYSPYGLLGDRAKQYYYNRMQRFLKGRQKEHSYTGSLKILSLCSGHFRGQTCFGPLEKSLEMAQNMYKDIKIPMYPYP
jgi:hypothetical protein